MLRILEEFSSARAQREVVSLFLRLGLRVNHKGKIFAGPVELSSSKIAVALDVDRRVVVQTAQRIAKDEKLLQIFFRLDSRAFIGNAAKDLGFDVVELHADARQKGVVAEVSRILAEEGLMIRQAICDDPELFPEPVLTIVVDGKIPPYVLEKIRGLSFTQSVLVK